MRRAPTWLMCALAALIMARAANAAAVDPSTLYGKTIMGYQGWFGCPGDGSGRGWVHWMNEKHEPTVDLLPDVSELDPDELCDSGWKDAEGNPIYLFSDQNPKTVDRHFKWMEDYRLDGVALQRFGNDIRTPVVKTFDDKVLANVRAAAARHGRVWFLMYDLSGVPIDKLPTIVEDWKALLADGVAADVGYQRHRGHAVLGLWGIGFAGRPMQPADALKLMADLRAATPGGLSIVGGVPTWWRDGTHDATTGWDDVWHQIDIISPWTVGRYKDDAGADVYAKTVLAPDMTKATAMGVDLMPVAFPGFSWANLKRARHSENGEKPNEIPRNCGAFLTHQITLNRGVAFMSYIAMFDEVDEGTAVFKLSSRDNFLNAACKENNELILLEQLFRGKR